MEKNEFTSLRLTNLSLEALRKRVDRLENLLADEMLRVSYLELWRERSKNLKGTTDET